MARGPLIILSGPAGSGKSVAVQQLLKEFPGRLRQSISVTTREPRTGELDGVHYRFWTRERFQEEVDRDGFLESAEVHGNLYGTPRSEVEPFLSQGIGVILVIDVQGAAEVRARCGDHVSIFLKTSAPEELEQRLRRRGTDGEEAIQRRLVTARKELERAGEYDYQVLNDDLEHCVAQLRALIEAEFRRREDNAR
jgi:guanylate kinase